jgi:hypothetical protein
MAKKKGKRKGINPKAYTLDTAIVRDYIIFYAVREMGLVKKVMPEDCQTEAEFCVKHGLAATSSNALHNYANIKGFYDEVDKEKRKNKHLLLSIGMNGLIKRGEGMKIVNQALDKDGEVHELESELPPDVRASERLIQLGGGEISDTVNINSMADIAREIAKMKEVKA